MRNFIHICVEVRFQQSLSNRWLSPFSHSLSWLASINLPFLESSIYLPIMALNSSMDIANTQNSVLITRDKDFGELVFNKKMLHSGIVLYRLHNLSTEGNYS